MAKKSRVHEQNLEQDGVEDNINSSFEQGNNQTFESESNPQNQESFNSVEINSLKAELEDWKDRAVRATADLQNVRHQADLDIAQAKKSAKKYVSNGFLPFLNTLNLAFAFAPQTDDQKIAQFIQTLKGSFSRLSEELNTTGIELITPTIGDEFDAEIMTALNEKSDDEEIPTVKNIATIGLKVDGQVTTAASVMI